MDDRAVAFTDAFKLLPEELQECVKAKRMASITVLGNLKDGELQKVFWVYAKTILEFGLVGQGFGENVPRRNT